MLYFFAQSFRAQLMKELPLEKNKISTSVQDFVFKAKGLIKELANISLEIAQMTVAEDGDSVLPDWFMVEIVRDFPRLAVKNNA